MNLNQIMKQAQEMQDKVSKIQEQMANSEFIGKSGAGLVEIKMSGKHHASKISIDDSLLNINEKEVLEDLIVAAFNDARNKIEESSKGSVENIFGGLPLPPGFKFPF